MAALCSLQSEARLAVGIEAVEDIVADLEQALRRANARRQITWMIPGLVNSLLTFPLPVPQ